MQRWAHIKNGVCENVSIWDGDTSRWSPPADVEMVAAPDHIGVGWLYDGDEWAAPPIVDPPDVVDLPVEE